MNNPPLPIILIGHLWNCSIYVRVERPPGIIFEGTMSRLLVVALLLLCGPLEVKHLTHDTLEVRYSLWMDKCLRGALSLFSDVRRQLEPCLTVDDWLAEFRVPAKGDKGTGRQVDKERGYATDPRR